MNYEIVPGILEDSQSQLQKKFQIASEFAPTIQIDIIDNDFANRTVNPDLAFTSNFTNSLELHFMTKSPEDWVDSYKNLNLKRIIGHVELMENVAKFIDSVQKTGAQPFLAIDLPTDIKDHLKDEYIKKGLKGFLIMTVKAGKSGQNFNPTALNKVKAIRQKYKEINIEIDGGVNERNIQEAKNAGVNIFTATSAIFNQDPKNSYQHLNSLLNK